MLFLWLYIYKHVLYMKSFLWLRYFIYVENRHKLIEKLITKNFRDLFYKDINNPFSYKSTDDFWSKINQFLLCLYELFWNCNFSVHLLAIIFICKLFCPSYFKISFIFKKLKKYHDESFKYFHKYLVIKFFEFLFLFITKYTWLKC